MRAFATFSRVVILFCLGAATLGAQTPASRPLPKLFPEAEEIALALEAALPNVSRDATVYVFKRGGHVVARQGTNGFACLVSRDHPESLYPICYDAEATRTILPVQIKQQELRELGKSEEEIDREVAARYADGTFKPPARPAMAYMMSPHQVIYASPKGPRVGQYKPHLMLYVPFATRASLGLDPSLDKNAFLVSEGTPRTHLIIPVSDWATTPPAPAPAR